MIIAGIAQLDFTWEGPDTNSAYTQATCPIKPWPTLAVETLERHHGTELSRGGQLGKLPIFFT
jgi:hypothetical protein